MARTKRVIKRTKKRRKGYKLTISDKRAFFDFEFVKWKVDRLLMALSYEKMVQDVIAPKSKERLRLTIGGSKTSVDNKLFKKERKKRTKNKKYEI